MNSRAPDAHGADDHLRLVEIADGKDGGFGQFLMQKFHSAHRRTRIVRRNIHHDHVGIGGLHPAHDWVRGRDRKTGARVYRPGYAGSVHQYLQHGALLVVRGDDHDRKLGHNL